jgi:hypothetical protein
MKRRLAFFLLVALAGALAHYLIVFLLSDVVLRGGAPAFVIPVLSVFTAPMNFVLSSSFGRTLSPVPFQVLFTANSLLWGSAVGAIILWRRLRYD